jgi:c-di-GMP-binding flagellar brake protein YcgR
MGNKRRQYRVRSSRTNDLRVRFALPGSNKVISGSVVDVSAGGMGVFFRQKDAPDLALKQTLLVEIDSREFSQPLLVPIMVRRCDMAIGGRTYGLEFIDWIGLLASLPPRLRKLFNRRDDFRVEPDPEKPVEVSIEGLPIKVTATLRDCSPKGLSVCLPSNMETVLLTERQMKVSFRPPKSVFKVTFFGTILHRYLAEEGICYGIFFDPRRTEEFNKNQNLLIKYINERRREVLGLPLQEQAAAARSTFARQK